MKGIRKIRIFSSMINKSQRVFSGLIENVKELFDMDLKSLLVDFCSNILQEIIDEFTFWQ